MNQSLTNRNISTILVCGNYHPVLKEGKDKTVIGGYRPSALTSTIGKLLEQMIAKQLPWWLEKHLILSPWQAGSQKDRSSTDRCLQLSQFVTDGFQSSQRRRTVATFFGFSRAYDGVWLTGLLLTRLKVPFVWLNSCQHGSPTTQQGSG